MSNDLREFVRLLKEQVDIVDLVSRTVPSLKKAGNSFKGLCPFHQEKTPSFNVIPARGIYHCFGCGAHGSAIDFVMQTDRLEFIEAVEKLARDLGLEMPRTSGRGREETDREQQLRRDVQAINEAALKWFRRNLLENRNPLATAYLPKRGITPELAERFQLGASLDEWDALKQHLLRLGFTESLLMEAGLCKQGERGGIYDRFRNRLIFPILDLNSRAIGFGGRVLDPDDDSAKYLNSPSTILFDKSRTLYALNLARPTIEKTGQAILCEGYMDALMAHAHGFTEAVATLGTALTNHHARQLKRFVSKTFFLYDGDAAGQKNMFKGGEPLLEAGLDVRVLSLPPDDDPDTYLRREGADTLRAQLENAEEFFDFALRVQSEGLDLATLAGQAELAERLSPILLSMRHDIMREGAIMRLLRRLGGLPREALTGIMERHRRQIERQAAARERTEQQPAATPTADSVTSSAEFLETQPARHSADGLERALLKVMVESHSALEFVRQKLHHHWVADPRFSPWILFLYDQTGYVDTLLDLAEVDNTFPADRGVITSVIAWDYPIGNDPRITAEEILRRLHERHQLRLTSDMLQIIREEKLPDQDAARFLRAYEHEQRTRLQASGRFLRARDTLARRGPAPDNTSSPPID